MTPKLKTSEKEPPVVVQQSPAVVKLQLEQIVTREAQAVAPRGWRFVPERDANGLIVEIIALPID